MCGSTTSHTPSGKSRPKSADLGGLNLATGSESQGHGWLGDGCDLQTPFAEALGDMYTETLNALNEPDSQPASWTDLPPATRERFIASLDSWNFEPHKLAETEVLQCTMLLFEGLWRIEGMQETVGISFEQMYPFIRHLRSIYRLENSYHNFQHALDVLQATFSFLRSAGLVPSMSILFQNNRTWRTDRQFDSGPLITCLGLQDIFILYVAAIGHDVGHPGFTNNFMKNANAPLAVVFNNKSALEQMHCALLVSVMRHHGLGPLLDRPFVRKLLWETVMATDMGVHAEFMERFEHLTSGEMCPISQRKVLLCQALMKCADISNPSRPYHVSQLWATRLMKEWGCQAQLEKQLSLPSTVQLSDDALSEAKIQVFFNQTFAKPLLELAVRAVPEMQMYSTQCTSNLLRWQNRKTELENLPSPVLRDFSPEYGPDLVNVFPLTLPTDWCGSDYVASSSESDETESLASSTVFSSGTGSDITSVVRGENHSAIRDAAGKALRKQRSILNRNSWSPMTREGVTATIVVHPVSVRTKVPTS